MIAYQGDLVKIDGITIPHVKGYKIGRSKLWKSADRNMSGSIRAKLIGIFPKIIMEVGVLNEEEMSNITALLDQDYFEVSWFDVRSKDVVSANYYAGDYEVDLMSKSRGLYHPFTVSLVPVDRRRY